MASFALVIRYQSGDCRPPFSSHRISAPIFHSPLWPHTARATLVSATCHLQLTCAPLESGRYSYTEPPVKEKPALPITALNFRDLWLVYHGFGYLSILTASPQTLISFYGYLMLLVEPFSPQLAISTLAGLLLSRLSPWPYQHRLCTC